jgi:hypothetical protein
VPIRPQARAGTEASVKTNNSAGNGLLSMVYPQNARGGFFIKVVPLTEEDAFRGKVLQTFQNW